MPHKRGSSQKRKRSDHSSQSEVESNTDTPSPTPATSKKKQKQKEQHEKEEMDAIHKELKAISEQMSRVLTKDDPVLKTMIKTVFNEMKEDFLQTVNNKLDILERRIFERETETDALKSKIANLEKKVADQEDENNQLRKDRHMNEQAIKEKFNEHEQYSRRNNIRIDGIKEDANEYADTTMDKVVAFVNTNLEHVRISRRDIDIAHRVGKTKIGKRQIIVKFVSRITKLDILRNKKALKDTVYSINEDLTATNLLALACVKKKQPDEIDSAWTREGRIKYKTKMGGTIHTLGYSSYQSWFDLPWPETSTDM